MFCFASLFLEEGGGRYLKHTLGCRHTRDEDIVAVARHSRGRRPEAGSPITNVDEDIVAVARHSRGRRPAAGSPIMILAVAPCRERSR